MMTWGFAEGKGEDQRWRERERLERVGGFTENGICNLGSSQEKGQKVGPSSQKR